MLPLSSNPETQAFIERARVLRTHAAAGLITRAGAFIGLLPAALAHGTFRLARAAGVAWRRRSAINSLKALDDRMLKDIGLYRGEIWTAADAAARGLEPPGHRPAPRPAPTAEILPLPTAAPASGRRRAA